MDTLFKRTNMTQKIVMLILWGSFFAFPCHSLKANPSFNLKIDKRQGQLEEVQSKLNSTKRRVVILSSQYKQLKAEIQRNAKEIRKVESKIFDLKRRISQGNQAIVKNQTSLSASKLRYKKYLERFSKRLLHLYRMRSRPLLAAVFQAQKLSDFLSRLEWYREVTGDDSRILTELFKNKNDIAKKKRELEEESNRNRLRKLRSLERNRELADLIAEKNLLDQIAKEKIYAKEKAGKLEKASRYLTSVISNLREGKKRFDDSNRAQRRQITRTHAIKPGTMRWPVDLFKRLVRPYGESNTSEGFGQLNRGIDLELRGLTTIRSVEGGKVIFRGNFSSVYGNVVMIDHGGHPDNLISIYGNLDSILVTNGQMVERGAPIGLVGTKSILQTRTAKLHFEIRQRTRAQNPLKWLTPLDEAD